MASNGNAIKAFNTRTVYNSSFVDTDLFDRLYIQKLKSTCTYVKENVLFSDIVKRNIVLNDGSTLLGTSTLKCQSKGTCSVSRGCQEVNIDMSKNSQPVVSQSYFSVNKTIKVNSVDNQKVYNMVSDTKTNVGNSIAQYQSEYAHVNKFASLAVEDDVFDRNSSVNRLHDVGAQVVETRAGVKSKYHKKGKRNSVHCVEIDGGLVKEPHGSASASKPHTDTQVHSNDYSAVTTGVPPLAIGSIDSNVQNSASNEITDDKYCLEINTTQKSEKIKLAKAARANEKFFEQNKPLFGFIPIYGLPSRVYDSNNGSICTDILQLHRLLRNDGRHNFKGLQIGVPSKLNAKIWAQYLINYWDWQLPLLIKYGFPLDFDRGTPLLCDNVNHKSALQYPEHVSTYLKEEIDNNAILVPFTEPPIDSLHTSPFMTRDKSSSVNRRVIIDLSWPIGNSVNSGVEANKYLDTEFVLTYPSIDNITDQVLQLGKSCEIFKVDISRAFCHVPIDPGDRFARTILE